MCWGSARAVADMHLKEAADQFLLSHFCRFLLLPGLAISSTEIQPKSDKPVYETGQTLANFLPSNNLEPFDAITLALNELDSPIFKVREKAIQQLVKLGEPAIEALALRSLDCTPETAWRIRKILEEISIAGDEPVFLKSIAILQIRFRSGMKSAAMRESFAKLENRWKSNRKKLAIQNLRALGAIVVDPLEDIDEDMAQIAGFQNEIFLLNPPGIAPRFPEVDQAGNPSTNQTTNESIESIENFPAKPSYVNKSPKS